MVESLNYEVRNQLVSALLEIPITDTFEGRSSLLIGIPKVTINRTQVNPRLDLNMIVDQFLMLGRDKLTGIRPLIVIIDNALSYIGSWQNDLSESLQVVRHKLEAYYAGDVQRQTLSPIEPEKLLFKGRDERISAEFLRKAIEAARSVCRLQVPRIFDGTPREGQQMFGTGWIIAPGLIITNHHVVEARERLTEPPALLADFTLQAEGTTLWFDYLREGGSFVQMRELVLETRDEKLDYAILRLQTSQATADRKHLMVVRKQPNLTTGYRLNIVQHSGGGPLIYAIRNNFYVGNGDSNAFLRYLTDTEPGASGSPVLNDSWEVVGLHHAAQPIPPEYYATLPQERFRTVPDETTKGEVITYHNEGIALHSILEHLPTSLRDEIFMAQGWS